jgi:phosphatidylinositol phosphate synthase
MWRGCGADFVLLVSVGSAGVLAAYAVRVATHGRVENVRLERVRGTRLLGRYPIEAFHWVASVVGRMLARTPVKPDTLTMVSLALTALTLPLVATGHFEAAGAVLLFGSSFDVLDGIVARERGVAGEAGEMLDSVVDRYADAACLIGLGLFYRDSAWKLGVIFSALLGSTMVSYVRAKAEKFRLSLPDTTMRRAERVVYLSGALILGPTLSGCRPSPDALPPWRWSRWWQGSRTWRPCNFSSPLGPSCAAVDRSRPRAFSRSRRWRDEPSSARRRRAPTST